MKELFQEVVRYPWVIPLVLAGLWLFKHRAKIKKGGVTAVKPFRESAEAPTDEEPVGYEAAGNYTVRQSD